MATKNIDGDIRDPALADEGRRRIEWAFQEMPVLSELHDKYKDMGFTVLGVNVEENSGAARKLLRDMPVSFPVLFDNDSTVSRKYDVVAMPSTVLVDRDGNVRYLHKGYKPGEEDIYLEKVRSLIRE